MVKTEKKIFKIATPVSHLFRNKDIKEEIIKISDILELRNPIPNLRNDLICEKQTFGGTGKTLI